MPQTLLSIFAILTVSILSFNQQRASTHARMQMIRTEVETQAETVAMEVMESLRGLAFDEASRNGGAITSASQFGTLSTSKVGNDSQQRTMSFSQVNDLSDLKTARAQRIDRQGKHGTIPFDVNFDVRYVRQQSGSDRIETTSDKTFTKEVVLEITHPLLNSPITISRVFAYRR